MIFENKQKKIESQLGQYNQKIILCLELFTHAVKQYCQDKDRGKLYSNFLKVHSAESMADDIRREIEVMMYTKALFPESRGDILGLLETMDKVPNQAESAVRMLLNQHVIVPDEMNEQVIQLADVCRRCVEAMVDSADKVFTDFTNATVAIGKVDELESIADGVEENLIEQIFTSEIDGADKLLLRDLVKHIAEISDRAENVGDRIRIIVAKRRV